MSAKKGTGRHTTSDPRLIPLPGGGAVVDTAGVRTFHLPRMDRADLEAGFPEIAAAAAGCRFRGCAHDGDAGCAVAAVVSPERLDSYRRMLARTPLNCGSESCTRLDPASRPPRKFERRGTKPRPAECAQSRWRSFMSRPRRFLPPIAGGAQKTGWEALDKWVGSGSGDGRRRPRRRPAAERQDRLGGPRQVGRLRVGLRPAAAAAPAAEAAAAPSGKTGWEALDKWVGGSGVRGAASRGRGRGGSVRQDRLGGARQVGRLRRSGSAAAAAPAAEAAAAPSGKTGWEALDKWVGAPAPARLPRPTRLRPRGKTGWEALDKWVGDGGTPSAETSAANGGAGTEQPVAAGAATASEGGGGLMGFLKRLFGGK